MKWYVDDIKEAASRNDNFRQVLHTGEHGQVVVMSLLGGEDIGSEVHDLDQIFYVVEGVGQVMLNGETKDVSAGSLIYVPEGAEHNLLNTGEIELKLFTIYTPPAHRDGTVHATKEEALADEEDHY